MRALGYLATAQLAIGAAAIFARYGLAGAGPLAVAAGRLTIAALAVLAIARARPRARGPRLGADPPTERRLVAAGLALAAHFAFWIASLRYTGVAVSTLLVTTTPVFTEIYDAVRTRRVRPLAVVSIALAIVGVAIVTTWGSATAAVADPRPFLGDALALAGSLVIGVYFVLVRASDPSYATLAVVGRTYPVAAVALLVAAAVAREGPPALADAPAWGGIAGMALLSQLYGHTALNAAVRRFTPPYVSMTTLVEPAIAGALAALLFHERVAAGAYLGAAFVLTGIVLALRGERAAVAAAEPSA